MKSNIRKTISRTVALILSLSMLATGVGCGGSTGGGSSDSGKKKNPNATQLTVQLFEGGYEKAWLENIVAAYEEKNQDVQITIKTTVNSVSAEQLVNAGKSTYDLVMLNYGFWQDSYAGKIVDLTDVYKSVPEGESKSIMEKCNASLVNFYNIGTAKEPKFNQMSWATTYTGICYNKTTLDEVLGEGNWTLPNTTDEFLALCKKVQGNGSEAYAFVFNGQDDNYMDTYLKPVWTAQYMGYEAYYNYCHGKYRNENGEYVEAGSADGQKLVEQNGSLAAMKVFEELCTNYCHPYSSDLSFNNAQKVFCGYGSGVKTQKVAFMANGDWVESEVSTLLANKPQDIRMMKLPVVSAITEKCTTIKDDKTLSAVITAIDSGAAAYEGVSEEDFARVAEARKVVMSLCDIHSLAIPATSQHVEEVKDFLVFMFSDEGQAIYAKTLNGLTMPYGFDVTTDSSIEQTEYVKSVKAAVSDDAHLVFVADYSSPYIFFGGFSGIPESGASALFNKTATAESVYKDYLTQYGNRWSQILSQSKGTKQ